MLSSDLMVIDPPFRGRLAAHGLDTVARVLACGGDHLAAWSRTSDVIRVDFTDGPGAVFIKRYHYPRWRHRWRAFFRGVFFGASRARNEFHTLQRMRALGIHAVRPVAWGERRFTHFVQSCFLITEAVPEAMSLAAFAQSYGRPEQGRRASPRVRHEFLRSLAEEIRRMHEAGFVHQDLFWRNVLVRPLSQERFEFYFLDASLGRRIRRARARREKKFVYDLAALSVLAPDFCSRADQLRFMRTYLNASTLSETDRAWLLDVQRHWGLYRETELKRLRQGQVFDSIRPAAPPIGAA